LWQETPRKLFIVGDRFQVEKLDRAIEKNHPAGSL